MLVEDIGNYLIEKEIGSTVGVDIFLSFRPDEPADVVVLREYSGPPVAPGVDAASRRVQVLVRGKNDYEVHQKSWAIHKLFSESPEPIHTSSGRWMVANPLQSPFPLEIDAHDRTVYVFNIGITTSKD